ncbi:DoxX family protein [Paenibacillus sp. 1P07SE]|uniref:DoxX family protein n=1 Tax=Paenibacillus sp. 1P07SE TaxID=3132209 RepID=UPI0039A69CF8
MSTITSAKPGIRSNMIKRNKVIYWIATIWLALGVLSAGIVQLMGLNAEVEMMLHLGYPSYLLVILGASKLLSIVAILVPGFPVLKEWSYAGLFFTMAGAMMSHLMLGDSFGEIYQSMLLLILTIVSWYFRPENRKPLINKRKF